MLNRWLESELQAFVLAHPALSPLVAQKLYSSRLLGQEPSLVLHGGGNSSLKHPALDCWGQSVDCLYIKASGADMAHLTERQLPAVKLAGLMDFLSLDSLEDRQMAALVGQHLLDPLSQNPSLEVLVHSGLPARSIDHTHADALLTLSLIQGGAEVLSDLYPEFVVLPYQTAGFKLAKQVHQAFLERPQVKGMILMHHGLLTFGDTPQESYDRMITAVSQAETQVHQLQTRELPGLSGLAKAEALYLSLAPVLRGRLRQESPNPICLSPRFSSLTERLIRSAPDLLAQGPITPDHLIRTKARPLVLGRLSFTEPEALIAQVSEGLAAYQAEESARQRAAGILHPSPVLPKVVLVEQIGLIGLGPTPKQADMARDIAQQTLGVKQAIWQTGRPMVGLEESQLVEMETRPLQVRKLKQTAQKAMTGNIALITGAAGAIGSGIAHELAEAGAMVVLTDLNEDRLDQMATDFKTQYPDQIFSCPLNVTDPQSVKDCFDRVVSRFGGLDTLVINAGLAYVSSLADMELERFRLLEQVNLEGTLLLLQAGGKFFKVQGCGGDVVLVSTKNVFSPSASFGAYSATKTGAHQLARVASLEFAPLGVRVNMVSPDGVFSDAGGLKSGLWATVGPDRMKARGLDEAGLEAYYQNRNLLKTQVTARHVGKAVLYFATRQSPCTGATLPVDGGLPEATPR